MSTIRTAAFAMSLFRSARIKTSKQIFARNDGSSSTALAPSSSAEESNY
jgi:hypothetical protein